MQAGNLMEKPAAETPCIMTPESISAYIQYEADRGASENALRNYRKITKAVYEWLPEDKVLTKDRLLSWRQALKDHGYSPDTELNYVKGINRYLDYIGQSDLRFNRGRAKDIAGKQFGYLTAIEPTGEKHRKDFIWRCVCKCGKEVEYPATRLLTGNTLSCGCLKGEHFKAINKYYGGTSLRQSIEEKVLGLLDFYEELHKDDPVRPNREQVRQMQEKPLPEPPTGPRIKATRNNNTSGYPGVHRKRDKWAAKITYQKVTYQLGTFSRIEDAIDARQTAELHLRNAPELFSEWVLQNRRGESRT